MTKILLLSGRKGSGKDTLTKFFMENVSSNICRYAFADSLKEICSDLFDIPLENFHKIQFKEDFCHLKWEDMPHWDWVPDDNQLWKEFGYDKRPVGYMKNREILQYFGSDICRKMYSHIWASKLLKIIENEKPLIACISDTRFPNEIQIFKNHKSLHDVFGYENNKLIEDVKCIRLMHNFNGSSGHKSETALDNYEFDEIINDGPIDYVNECGKYLLNKWNWLKT